MDLPAVMEERGVAGIISPQALREEEILLIDLAAGSMRLYRAGAAVSAHRGGCTFRSSRRCDPPSAADSPLFVVQANIGGGAAASLVVDTGDVHSDVLTGSAPHSGQAWTFGSCTAKAALERVPGRVGLCRRDGALGMDVLRSCTLQFDADHIEGGCNP
jgi:hypothetical protein